MEKSFIAPLYFLKYNLFRDNYCYDTAAITSPAASQVQVMGTTDIPPGDTVVSTTGSAPINAPPTSPTAVDRLRIMLTLKSVLRAGLNIPLTFAFQHAGTVTLLVPTGARSDVISGS